MKAQEYTYGDLFGWAFGVGKKIKEASNIDGDRLLRNLIFKIRAEETPGRFLEELSITLSDYRTNANIGIDVTLHPDIYAQTWFADRFHYMKASILTGLLNALASAEKR